MNIPSHSPLRTWLLGRFSISLPEYMLPNMPQFLFQWENRTPDNDYALAYPISLNEQPYADAATAKAEWRKTVDELIEDKQTSFWGLAFHWDVSKLFDVPAYLICYKKNALFNFHIMLQRPECLMHLIGRHGYYYPDTAQKGPITDNILRILAEFYRRYRPGHATRSGNVFHTCLGELHDVVVNRNEKMSVLFTNKEKNLLWGVDTSINYWEEKEEDLRSWMGRLGGIAGAPSSRMRKLPHLPNKGFESLEKRGNGRANLTLEYAGRIGDPCLPSFSMGLTKRFAGEMDAFRDLWEVILEHFLPLQQKKTTS
ncbi:MAG TPA: hypothetical protein H9774_06835 [Candidatus Desulfovibrio gallistercoris]|nr:hypothetical protein [Candidatus Desulfovibrio gallistercoris]